MPTTDYLIGMFITDSPMGIPTTYSPISMPNYSLSNEHTYHHSLIGMSAIYSYGLHPGFTLAYNSVSFDLFLL